MSEESKPSGTRINYSISISISQSNFMSSDKKETDTPNQFTLNGPKLIKVIESAVNNFEQYPEPIELCKISARY